jgi:hypothetical protein
MREGRRALRGFNLTEGTLRVIVDHSQAEMERWKFGIMAH